LGNGCYFGKFVVVDPEWAKSTPSYPCFYALWVHPLNPWLKFFDPNTSNLVKDLETRHIDLSCLLRGFSA
jgi:hypothetical protein